MLATLIEVMASVPVGETKFVDLYANHGNADPDEHTNDHEHAKPYGYADGGEHPYRNEHRDYDKHVARHSLGHSDPNTDDHEY